MALKIREKLPFGGKKEGLKYGVLDTNFLSFVTPLMFAVIGGLIFLAFFSFDTLYAYFATNKALNGLIIGLLIFGASQIYMQNVMLYRTALFLKSLDDAAEKDEITDEDVKGYLNDLMRRGKILNIIQMDQCIRRIKDFGRLQFTDNDARFIKSKLGFRLNLLRGGVNFLAGLLVMLGLLGTFLGLLKTIDAIGAALGTMASLTDASGMNKFIAALAAPLQGMGLAFSSSLFGLSGSLLIGFLSYLSGPAQNRFMEDVSRWIDNRIPKFDPKKIPEKQMQKAPSQDDMKTWLSGYVYLANKTNQKLGRLYELLTTMAETGIEANQSTKQMAIVTGETKDIIREISQSFQQDMQAREGFFNELSGNVSSVDKHLAEMIQNIDQARTSFAEQMQTAIDDVAGKIDTMGSSFADSVNAFTDKVPNLDEHAKTQQKQMESLVGEIQMIKRAGDRFRSAQMRLSDELGLLATVLQDKNADNGRVTEAMEQVHQALREITTLRKVLHAQVAGSPVSAEDKKSKKA